MINDIKTTDNGSWEREMNNLHRTKQDSSATTAWCDDGFYDYLWIINSSSDIGRLRRYDI